LLEETRTVSLYLAGRVKDAAKKLMLELGFDFFNLLINSCCIFYSSGNFLIFIESLDLTVGNFLFRPGANA